MPTIRPPVPDDADRLGTIHVAAWLAAYRGLMPDDYLDNLSTEERAAMWAEGLSREPRARRTRLVAENDKGEVVGFVVAGPTDGDDESDLGEIYSLNVHPDAWGTGAGRALLEAATDHLREVGFPDAILWVHPGNERARRFYESAGWTRDGSEREVEVLGLEVPEVAYRRSLAT